MSQMKDIDALIRELTPSQIRQIMDGIKRPTKARSIDGKYAARRHAINSLYFNNEPQRHMFATHEEYENHAEGLRQQVISGVDL